jgi:hypothetical protein
VNRREEREQNLRSLFDLFPCERISVSYVLSTSVNGGIRLVPTPSHTGPCQPVSARAWSVPLLDMTWSDPWPVPL